VKTVKSVQEIAQRKLVHAQRQVKAKQKALKRLMTSLALWDRRVKYYTKAVLQTDAERAAYKALQAARRAARSTRRGIKLDGGVGG